MNNAMLALLLTYCIFFILAMIVPSVRVWRATGINPLVLARDDSAEGFVAGIFKLALLMLGGYFLLGSLGFTSMIGSFQWPLPAVVASAGWCLIVASLVWVLVAHVNMGRSWRIGIDHAQTTDLVSGGLFRFSRNPIFLGMMVLLVGLVMVQPDAITLAALVAGFISISVQIRFEEQHLLALHGDAYAQYCNKVRRWI
jgi:protein-S-isoprenylcysteine O-methyltransferase Ste14